MHSTRTLAAAAALATLLGTTGCVIEVIRGSGVPATETLELPSFDRLANDTFLEVEVLPGEPRTITLHCDDNLLDELAVVRVGDELQLTVRQDSDRGHLRTLEPRVACWARLVAPGLVALENNGSGRMVSGGPLDRLSAIDSSGSGDVQLVGIAVELLEIRSSGSGNVTVAGSATRVEIDASGSGGIDAADLTSCVAEVTSSGSGNVEVHAVETVEVELSGSGNVTVYGDPDQRHDHVTGSGQVDYD